MVCLNWDPNKVSMLQAINISKIFFFIHKQVHSSFLSLCNILLGETRLFAPESFPQSEFAGCSWFTPRMAGECPGSHSQSSPRFSCCLPSWWSHPVLWAQTNADRSPLTADSKIKPPARSPRWDAKRASRAPRVHFRSAGSTVSKATESAKCECLMLHVRLFTFQPLEGYVVASHCGLNFPPDN